MFALEFNHIVIVSILVKKTKWDRLDLDYLTIFIELVETMRRC